MTGDSSHAARDEHYAKQKRARGQLSCVPCRVGKLKCNRVRNPACDQCLKRNRDDSCHYVPPPTKAKPPPNVKGRIRQLESLVRTLMEKQAGSSESNDSSPRSDDDSMQDAAPDPRKTNGQVETSFGKLDINQDEISYKGDHHWLTILSSLSEIQKELGDDDDEHTSPITATESSGHSPDKPLASNKGQCIFGTAKAMTRRELLASLPEKRVCDRLLSLWFNSPDPFKFMIHAPTFQDEYKRLWIDQSVTNMWLALLFSLLCLAEAFGLRNAAPNSPEASACSEKTDEYQSLAASAAVLADFTKPKPYTLECLMMYMIGVRGYNASLNAWLIMGVIVRLALRMGYHRDPDYFTTKVSPFQAEMRRRVWSLVQMIDVLMSFQLGLPSMVRNLAADTLPPKNLLDRDFTALSPLIPPSRSEEELTPCLYIIAKLRLMAVFSEAAELSHATTSPDAEVVLKLDEALELAKSQVPQALQMPDVSEIVTDPAEQLMCRFNLDLLYLKCKIVLFRRYMLVPIGKLSEAEQKRGIGAGRESCIKAARQVLDHHATIYNATQPGGQMEHMKWYMGSISTHDFLLAAMVICLELSQQLQKDKMLRISNGMLCPTRTAMLNALERTHQIWTDTANAPCSATLHDENMPQTYSGNNTLGDTDKARKAMAVMLTRLKAQRVNVSSSNTPEECTREDVLTGNTTEHSKFFDTIGITPAGARKLANDGSNFHGVLSSHQWDSVPDDFVFRSGPSTVHTDTSPAMSLPPQPIMPLGQNGTFSNVDDGIDLDWQAWDKEIFNVAPSQNVDWLGTDASASYVDMSMLDGGSKALPAAHGFIGSLPPGYSLVQNVDMSGLDQFSFGNTPLTEFMGSSTFATANGSTG